MTEKRKPGRPKKADQQFSIRMSFDDCDRLKAIADLCMCSLSDAARICVRDSYSRLTEEQLAALEIARKARVEANEILNNTAAITRALYEVPAVIERELQS